MKKVSIRGATNALKVVQEQFGEKGLFYLGLAVIFVLFITKWRQGVREMAHEDAMRERRDKEL